MGKHHLELEGNTEFVRKIMFHSIRNKVLQKAVLIYYNILYSRDFPIAKRVIERLHSEHLPPDQTNIAWTIKPEDVMEIIHCSERTAKEYIDLIRVFIR